MSLSRFEVCSYKADNSKSFEDLHIRSTAGIYLVQGIKQESLWSQEAINHGYQPFFSNGSAVFVDTSKFSKIVNRSLNSLGASVAAIEAEDRATGQKVCFITSSAALSSDQIAQVAKNAGLIVSNSNNEIKVYNGAKDSSMFSRLFKRRVITNQIVSSVGTPSKHQRQIGIQTTFTASFIDRLGSVLRSIKNGFLLCTCMWNYIPDEF